MLANTLGKKEEHRQVRFETYHRLIKGLVEGKGHGSKPGLDRQIAVIFELRNFKAYYEVMFRIPKGLRDNWSDPNEKQEMDEKQKMNRKRLLDEIDLGIAFMEKERRRGIRGWIRQVF